MAISISPERRARSVFLNCPFDDEYESLFHAMVFTVIRCGFVARCALEVAGTEENRFEKIAGIIRDCDHSIHDLSRVELDKVNHLPRFNMPFELGLFFGARLYGGRAQKTKTCFVLDSKPHQYKITLSDIGGQDGAGHDNDYKELIGAVRRYLNSQKPKGSAPLPGKPRITKEYEKFGSLLPKLAKRLELDGDDIDFNDYVHIVEEYVTVS